MTPHPVLVGRWMPPETFEDYIRRELELLEGITASWVERRREYLESKLDGADQRKVTK